MNAEKVEIHEMMSSMLNAAVNAGYPEQHVWGYLFARVRHIVTYYERLGIRYYDPVITEEFIQLEKERVERGEIVRGTWYAYRHAQFIMDDYYLTGKFQAHRDRMTSKYIVNPENEKLIADFVESKQYQDKTRRDVTWIVRRYLLYFERKGFYTLENVTVDMVQEFILDLSAQLKISSLHNFMIFLKQFHHYLKENGISAPDCEEVFSHKVFRTMHIQGHITDDELDKVLSIIDDYTTKGKRNRAIILLAATTGLRACDICTLKLTDIDWRKGQISICQKKTKRMNYVPILKEVGEAMQTYILTARPVCDYQEFFLTLDFPPRPISCGTTIGTMFKDYQKRAGIPRTPFDGKGFHGLRRRLAKKMLVSGTPLTTIAQVLGHDGMQSSRQYLSLDTSNLKECALDFHCMPVERRELL